MFAVYTTWVLGVKMTTAQSQTRNDTCTVHRFVLQETLVFDIICLIDKTEY